MLNWHERARKSFAAFFVKWNDIDVYVEDTARFAKTLYLSLLSRTLSNGAKITDIFPLGDRKRVSDTAQADTGAGGRRRIYLIDPDLDLIAGIPTPTAPRLFTHAVYHVENYFVCEEALCEVLHEENARMTADDVRIALDFDGWLNHITPLRELFTVFGITRHIDPSLKTISLGIGQFQTDQMVDAGKIAAFNAGRIADLEARFSVAAVQAAKVSVDSAIATHARFQDLIAAREFLLPSLKWWAAARGLQWPSGKESALVRLAKRCSIARHQSLQNALEACSTLR